MARDDGGLANFSWLEEGKLAGMAWPDREAWETLKSEGVQAVLSLTEAPPPGDPRAAGLAWRHLPIEDFGVPDVDALREAVHWIQRQISSGKPVVVHCRAGLGRTGMVLAAYLAAGGTPAPQAIATVRTARPGSIETSTQQRLVERVAREFLKASGAS